MTLKHDRTVTPCSQSDQIEGICTTERSSVIYFWYTHLSQQSTWCPRFLRADATYAYIYIILPTNLI